MQMKISVLMTVYNDSKYLNSSIRSILNQSYSNFEFVIINDGSEDDSEKKILSYNDLRIKYFSINHSGRAAALNFGLNVCSNDWVALIDADDISMPDRLLEYTKIKNISYNVVITNWVKFFNMNGKVIFSICPDSNNEKIKKQLMLHSVILNCVFYNKKFILNHGGYNNDFATAVDYFLWRRILSEATFFTIPKYLHLMRFRSNSLSNSSMKRTNLAVRKIQKIYLYQEVEHLNKFEQDINNGWQEYFYGDKKVARQIWLKLRFQLLFLPKILIASILTFLPEQILEIWLKHRIRFRLQNIYDNIFCKNRSYNRFIKLHDL